MASTSEYWVGDAIGEGSFGVVVYGRHKTSNLHVAIKCVDKASLKRQPVHAFATVKEQQILKRINGAASKNSFVVHLYASFHDKECVYIVMECCSGGTLQDLLNHLSNTNGSGSSLNKIELVQYYGLQLTDGLSYLHETCQVIHCDLKPANVLLTEKGRIKLADFGSAVDLYAARASTSSTQHVSSARPLLRGTAAYSAPDLNVTISAQDAQPPVSFSVDLWSAGCILFAMLFDQMSPFDKGSEVACIDSIDDFCSSISTEMRYSKLFEVETTPLSSTSSETDARPLKTVKDVIFGLLNPISAERMSFAKQGQIGNLDEPSDIAYPHVRSSLAGLVSENDAIMKPEFLPPIPSWWTRNCSASVVKGSSPESLDSHFLSDGAAGWSVFLV
jgi:serine/threonine protein kinase